MNLQANMLGIHALQMYSSLAMAENPSLYQVNPRNAAIKTLAITIFSGLATALASTYLLPPAVVISLAVLTVGMAAYTVYKIYLTQYPTMASIHNLILQGEFSEAADALALFKETYGKNADKEAKKECPYALDKSVTVDKLLEETTTASIGLALSKKSLPQKEIDAMKTHIANYPLSPTEKASFYQLIDDANFLPTQMTKQVVKNPAAFLSYLLLGIMNSPDFVTLIQSAIDDPGLMDPTEAANAQAILTILNSGDLDACVEAILQLQVNMPEEEKRNIRIRLMPFINQLSPVLQQGGLRALLIQGLTILEGISGIMNFDGMLMRDPSKTKELSRITKALQSVAANATPEEVGPDVYKVLRRMSKVKSPSMSCRMIQLAKLWLTPIKSKPLAKRAFA